VALQEFPKDTQLMGGNDFYDKTVSGPEDCPKIIGLMLCILDAKYTKAERRLELRGGKSGDEGCTQ
jgi:hypothetical protein